MVIVGFLFNKSSLNLYFLVVQGLVLYLSLGWGIDVLVHRITLTLPLVHWFQLRLLLVNWEYLVDSLSGIMLVIIALISLNVNVVHPNVEQFIHGHDQRIYVNMSAVAWIRVQRWPMRLTKLWSLLINNNLPKEITSVWITVSQTTYDRPSDWMSTHLQGHDITKFITKFNFRTNPGTDSLTPTLLV